MNDGRATFGAAEWESVMPSHTLRQFLLIVALVTLGIGATGIATRIAAQGEPPLPLPTPRGQLGGPPDLVQTPDLPESGDPPPAATPSPGCSVEPLTAEEVLALVQRAAGNAAPAATPISTDPGAGIPASAATVAAITETLSMAAACTAAGDINRLLALLSDDYIVRESFAPEKIAIAPGTPPATSTRATPAGRSFGGITVANVRLLPDGRVSAAVTGGIATTGATVVFVQDENRWLIDEVNTE